MISSTFVPNIAHIYWFKQNINISRNRHLERLHPYWFANPPAIRVYFASLSFVFCQPKHSLRIINTTHKHLHIRSTLCLSRLASNNTLEHMSHSVSGLPHWINLSVVQIRIPYNLSINWLHLENETCLKSLLSIIFFLK